MAIWRLKDFAGPADPKGNLETLPLGEPLSDRRIEVGLQSFGHGIEMRVCVKDFKPAAHGVSPVPFYLFFA
jgi:hypothetical protein